jgi:hypothetical protein
MKDIYYVARPAFHLRSNSLIRIALDTYRASGWKWQQINHNRVSKRRKKDKKNKRAAQVKNLDDWSSMATTNGGAKAAKSVKKQNGLAAAAAAAKEPTKKTEIPSSDKKKVHSFMNHEVGPRVDKKKEAAEPAANKPRNDGEVTSDDREGGK